MNPSTPGLLVHHQLPEFTQIHVHWVGDAIQPSYPCRPLSSCPQSLPASGSFLMSQLFAWGGQSTGVSASASVLPMNTQDWSPLGWAGWISLQSKWLARVFSTTVQKHHIYHQMSFDKRVKATQCGKLSLQQIELGKLDIYMQKNDMRPLFNTTHKNYL